MPVLNLFIAFLVCMCVFVHDLCVCSGRQDFDKLLEAMKGALAEDSHSAFIFSCSNGKGRTTTAMVVSVLTLWHFNVRDSFGFSICSLRRCYILPT